MVFQGVLLVMSYQQLIMLKKIQLIHIKKEETLDGHFYHYKRKQSSVLSDFFAICYSLYLSNHSVSEGKGRVSKSCLFLYLIASQVFEDSWCVSP